MLKITATQELSAENYLARRKRKSKMKKVTRAALLVVAILITPLVIIYSILYAVFRRLALAVKAAWLWSKFTNWFSKLPESEQQSQLESFKKTIKKFAKKNGCDPEDFQYMTTQLESINAKKEITLLREELRIKTEYLASIPDDCFLPEDQPKPPNNDAAK